MLRLRGLAMRYLTDGTALVTAWLLALCLPPDLPLWQGVLGISLALIFGKHVYGGLGKNVFNPAMVGFAILIISFPLSMSAWSSPLADGVSSATPLDAYKFRQGLTNEEFFDSQSQANWQVWVTINLAFLLGGVLLLYQKIISWQAPIGFLGAIGLLAIAFYDGGSSMSLGSPLFHWLSGATMLAAFFVITDPVTSPMRRELLLLYGAGIGGITFLIRVTGAYPEGIAFAVLLMNACAPLMDQVHSLRERTS